MDNRGQEVWTNVDISSADNNASFWGDSSERRSMYGGSSEAGSEV
jgi:hypothetical protein